MQENTLVLLQKQILYLPLMLHNAWFIFHFAPCQTAKISKEWLGTKKALNCFRDQETILTSNQFGTSSTVSRPLYKCGAHQIKGN